MHKQDIELKKENNQKRLKHLNNLRKFCSKDINKLWLK